MRNFKTNHSLQPIKYSVNWTRIFMESQTQKQQYKIANLKLYNIYLFG